MQKDLQAKTDMFDKHLQNTKNEIGRQMHEMFGMVEEIAQLAKKSEIEIKSKELELKETSTAMATLLQ